MMAQTDESTCIEHIKQSVWFLSSCLNSWKDDFHEKNFIIEPEHGGSRAFNNHSECMEFIGRVKEGGAVAKAFKEFPYKGKGLPFTVEREIWYHDRSKDSRTDRKYVIVHVHFADAWDQSRHENRERHNVSGITQVNLRHVKLVKCATSEPGSQKWRSMFEDATPEARGRKLFSYSGVGGWKWKQQPATSEGEAGAETQQPATSEGEAGAETTVSGVNPVDVLSNEFANVNLNVPRRDDLIQWFDGDRPLARGDANLQPEIEKMRDLMDGVEKAINSADPIRFSKAELEQRYMPSRIGVEVLAIGNNAYDIRGISVLQNCIRDAHAVTGAFKNVGARCHPVVENVISPNQLTKCIVKWVEECLWNADDLRIVFLFWAGHSLSQEGSIHLLTTWKGSGFTKDDIDLGETVAIKEVVEMIREHISDTVTVVVCLDSCRTEGSLPQAYQGQGGTCPADGAFNNTEFWYATGHGQTAGDGLPEAQNSLFTRALIRTLGEPGNLEGKTFEEIWREMLKILRPLLPENQIPMRAASGEIENYVFVPKAARSKSLVVGPREYNMLWSRMDFSDGGRGSLVVRVQREEKANARLVEENGDRKISWEGQSFEWSQKGVSAFVKAVLERMRISSTSSAPRLCRVFLKGEAQAAERREVKMEDALKEMKPLPS